MAQRGCENGHGLPMKLELNAAGEVPHVRVNAKQMLLHHLPSWV
jgi:hypothetical protein